jgi:hypothetical protein
MKMCELPIDQERLRRADRFARRQDERTSSGHGYTTGLLDDTRQRKHTARQFLYPSHIGRLLIKLCVRVGRGRTRAIADAHR